MAKENDFITTYLEMATAHRSVETQSERTTNNENIKNAIYEYIKKQQFTVVAWFDEEAVQKPVRSEADVLNWLDEKIRKKNA